MARARSARYPRCVEADRPNLADPDCEPTVRSAGEGFIDVGSHAHIARNESGAPARNVVVYLAPAGATLRRDQPNPGNCAFRGF